MQDVKQEDRKKDHIDLAFKSATLRALVDDRFYYEPLFSAHPDQSTNLSTLFLGKKLNAPLWISSMTGGVGPARHLNLNLARVCREFGLGMGLGSCRVLLDGLELNQYFNDFKLRPIIGKELPFFANLGIAQVETLLYENNLEKITDLVGALDADGLIVHINPLQEWFQPEGDRLKFSPLVTLTKLCQNVKTKIIVKEVGQGMGPKSLKALLDLPIAGIELAAFGGTNFSKLEQLRSESTSTWMEPLSHVGHTAPEMVYFLNKLLSENKNYNEKQIIISGGVENILDGYNLHSRLNFNSVIGQAKNFLAHAENYEELQRFVSSEIAGLKVAKAYLAPKSNLQQEGQIK